MTVTAKLSADNNLTETATCGSFSATLSAMAYGLHPKQVALRLRAVMADLDMKTVAELAEFLGAERSQVSNWLQGYNLPPTKWMNELCLKRRGLTLDWIFRGISDALPSALAIKLEALEQGMEVPLNRQNATDGGGAAPSGFSEGARKRGRTQATRYKMAT
jgi:transcriptional regulator with XRE-family HTH domain